MAKAILVGASGLVGSHCLSFLLESPGYERVTILVRRPLTLPASTPGLDKLDQQTVDFNHLDLSTSLFQGDHLFICLGTTLRKAGSREAFFKVDFTYAVQCARLAAKEGVSKTLLVSSVGADAKSRFFYPRVKGQTEAAIAEAGLNEVHFFRPSFLLGERDRSRPLEKLTLKLLKPLAPLMIGPARRYRPVEARTVARRMVENALAAPRPGVWIHENEQI